LRRDSISLKGTINDLVETLKTFEYIGYYGWGREQLRVQMSKDGSFDKGDSKVLNKLRSVLRELDNLNEDLIVFLDKREEEIKGT
jgi:hypothetical protein